MNPCRIKTPNGTYLELNGAQLPTVLPSVGGIRRPQHVMRRTPEVRHSLLAAQHPDDDVRHAVLWLYRHLTQQRQVVLCLMNHLGDVSRCCTHAFSFFVDQSQLAGAVRFHLTVKCVGLVTFGVNFWKFLPAIKQNCFSMRKKLLCCSGLNVLKHRKI